MSKHARPLALSAALALPAALLAAPVGAVGHRPPAPATDDDSFRDDVRPLVERYCGDCHSGADPEGALDLLAFEDGAAAAADPYVWELVRERVVAGEMPPRVLPQPTDAERATLVGWVDATFGPAPEVDTTTPGRTVLRRLNRFEVENALLDVLGVRVDADRYLPLDEAADGFDTVGSALSFTDVHLDGLLDLAEDVAARAVPWVDPAEGAVRQLRAEDFEVDERFLRDGTLGFFTNGEARTRLAVGRDGEYELRVRARATQAGDELARMRLGVDGAEVASLAVEHDGEGFVDHVARVRLAAGERVLTVAFVNDHYEPEHPNPRRRDRNLYVRRVEVRGPLGVQQASEGLTARAEADLAGTVAALATALWRRPPEHGDLERLLALSPPDTPAPLALRTVLVALVASPRFLFRVEREPLGAPARALDGYELATRLALFLWSSVPDAELRARAADGSLTDPDVLTAEAERLLADARASRLVEGFAEQWLQLRPLREHAPDPKRFPDYDAELRAAMRAETTLLFEAVLREDRPLADLVAPGFTFLNERLATHYGLEGVEGPLMRRVPLADARRGGLLSQASVLTATSYPTRTSPVLRGKWVLEVLLGDPPPPPPPDVPVLSERRAADGPRSLRAALEQHRADPACSACHAAMDPLGFGLEPYDAIGAWRAEQDGAAVDARGELPDGSTFDGPEELKALLARDPRLARNVTERLMVYALGRALAPGDRAEAEAIAARLAPERDSPRDAVLAVVRSKAFRTLQADPADADAGRSPAAAAGDAQHDATPLR